MELEWKYRADPALFDEIRRELTGREDIFQMETVYYDTPGADFSRRRCTLRLRRENERSVCTLKAPGSGAGRPEWEGDCRRMEEAAAVLCKLGAPAELLSLMDGGLLPICGARFQRIAVTVTLPEAVVEVALDAGILTGGKQKLPFGELEVELKSGSETAALAFARALAARYALTEEPLSKFARALALYKGETYGSVT